MLSNRLIDVKEAAERLGLSVSYLNKLRVNGTPPGGTPLPFVKIGAAVKYDPADLDAWVEAQKRRSTSDTGTAVA